MKLSTLWEWLNYIHSIHPSQIELGLDRVKKVARRLGVLTFDVPIIIVGGTNGKGSTVHALEAIYNASGLNTGMFNSPYLIQYNEVIRIKGKIVRDDELIHAFQTIEEARKDVLLTPFEFGTLAALVIFKSYNLDVLILEVGLGGRLDAVNILDADLAIITNVDMDHMEWLGSTREAIALEKAGIIRKNKPLVCGDLNSPYSLIKKAYDLNVPLHIRKQSFHHQKYENNWAWNDGKNEINQLPLPSLALKNMANVLMAVHLLQLQLPVSYKAIHQGLMDVKLPGRIEIIKDSCTKIYDVSHNPHAIAHLAKNIKELPCIGKTYALFSMLMDKDRIGSMRAIMQEIDHWFVAPLETERATPIELLKKNFEQLNITSVNFYSSISKAYEELMKKTAHHDRVIIFGSFHTVSSCMR